MIEEKHYRCNRCWVVFPVSEMKEERFAMLVLRYCNKCWDAIGKGDTPQINKESTP